MRTDKKVGKDNIVVNYTDEINTIYIRKSGKDNKYNTAVLCAIKDDQLIINTEAARSFGIKIVDKNT